MAGAARGSVTRGAPAAVERAERARGTTPVTAQATGLPAGPPAHPGGRRRPAGHRRPRGERPPPSRRRRRLLLRAFQGLALAEGTALPLILLAATVHAVTGLGGLAVAITGAAHGTLFTLYLAVVGPTSHTLGWSRRRLATAIGVSVMPFAPWWFERSIRPEINAVLGGEARRRR